MASKLFVYGTLRQGAPMHGLIDGRARWLGSAEAPGRLLDLGAYPALAPARGKQDRVIGELYEVAESERAALLDVLDRYEGPSFERVLERVRSPEGPAQAWLYRWRGDPRGRALVPGGDYLAWLAAPRAANPPPGGRP